MCVWAPSQGLPLRPHELGHVTSPAPQFLYLNSKKVCLGQGSNNEAKFTSDKVFRNLLPWPPAHHSPEVIGWVLAPSGRSGTWRHPKPTDQCPLVPCLLSSRLIPGTHSLIKSHRGRQRVQVPSQWRSPDSWSSSNVKLCLHFLPSVLLKYFCLFFFF